MALLILNGIPSRANVNDWEQKTRLVVPMRSTGARKKGQVGIVCNGSPLPEGVSGDCALVSTQSLFSSYSSPYSSPHIVFI